MKQIQIKYQLPILDDEKQHKKDDEGKKMYTDHSVNLMVPEDFDEAGQIYGKETFYAKGMAQIIIAARRLCYEAESEEQAQQFMNNFTPGVPMGRQTAAKKKELLALLDAKGLTAAEIEAMVEMVKGEN